VKRAFAVAALLCGCGTSGRTTPDATVEASVEDGGVSFAYQFAATVCDAIDACCTQNGYRLDHDSCVTILSGQKQRELNTAVAVAGLRLDPDGAARCLVTAREVFSACPTTDWAAASTRYLRACSTFSGSTLLKNNDGPLLPGASCSDDTECSDRACLDAGGAVSVCFGSTCRCLHLPKLGEECDWSNDHIWMCNQAPEGDFTGWGPPFRNQGPAGPRRWTMDCDTGDAGIYICQSTAPLGTACNPNSNVQCGGETCDKASSSCVPGSTAGSPCSVGVRCDSASYCVSGTCKTLLQTGATCAGADWEKGEWAYGTECASRFCDFGAPADGGAGRCIASPFAPFSICGSL
jgi:hypothetical protein